MVSILRAVRDLWLIAGMCLLALLLVDALLEAWLPEASGWPRVVPGAEAPARARADALAGADWVPAYFAEFKRARHTHWVPYVYWRREPFQGEFINIGADGLRQGWQPPATGGPVVWVFGGSTVWGTGARDAHTLPSALARVLNERGITATVINFGESGYVSRQGLLAMLEALATRPRPAAIVFYDGVNDVFSALQSGQAGWPQNESLRRAEFRATDGLDNWLAAFPDTLEGIHRLLGRARAPDLEPLAGAVVERYLDTVSAARAVAGADSIPTFFFWQPSVFTRSAPSAFEQQVIDASLAAHRELQLAVNAGIAERATRRGVVDLSHLLDDHPDSLYLDFCHLSEAGNRRVAEAIGERLLLHLTRDR